MQAFLDSAKAALANATSAVTDVFKKDQDATAEAHGEYTGYAPSSPAPAPAPAGPMNIGGRRRKSRKAVKKGGRRHRTARK